MTTFYQDLLPLLAENDMEIDVYISSAEYRPGRTLLSSKLKHPNLRFKYLPSFGLASKKGIQKIGLMFFYALFASLTSLFSRSFDVNFFLTQPPFFSLWGWLLKKLRGQKYMCLIMDIYPDVAVQDGVLRCDSLLVRFLSTLNLFIWKQADAVVVIGRCMQEYLLQKGISAERIHFVPNWANEKIIYPVPLEQNAFKSECGLQDAFIVLYSGNMGVLHEFQTLLIAAEELLHQKAIKFVFIGDGYWRFEIEKLARDKMLDNILFFPFQPLERLAESLSIGDVHLVTLRRRFTGLVVPSKAYGALLVGRPLIYVGEHNGEIARMVNEEKIGATIACGDGRALAETILSYYNNESVRLEHGQRAFQLSQDQYSRKRSLSAYLNIIMGDLR